MTNLLIYAIKGKIGIISLIVPIYYYICDNVAARVCSCFSVDSTIFVNNWWERTTPDVRNGSYIHYSRYNVITNYYTLYRYNMTIVLFFSQCEFSLFLLI